MGLLNLPTPLFNAIDALMAIALPAGIRLGVWALIAGVGTVLLYRLLSPQKRIGEAKREARAARRRLNAFDGEFADAGPLIRDQFVTAFRHLGLVVPGTLLAVLPMLCLLVWADGHYGYRLPAGATAPPVQTVPRDFDGHWQAGAGAPHVRVTKNGHQIADFEMSAPVNEITKRSWWNWLIANPVGYLPDDSPLERIDIALPARQYLPFGPGWLRGWLGMFIPIMFIVSLLIYKWARIE